MADCSFLDTEHGPKIAYHLTPGLGGAGPCVVFLAGLKSDMQGTKALHLEAWARARGQAFLRFDYSGHGQSSGKFESGCIGDWAEDTIAAVSALTEGPLVVVGSSMGGWQALLLARRIPGQIAGMVTIAAAPDFTEDGYWQSFSAGQKAMLERDGQIELPSDYTEPYVITKRLIEDGRRHLVLRAPLPMAFPVRLLQGTADRDVDQSVALRLFEHMSGDDVRLILVKGADHRFSSPECLGLITRNVEDILQASRDKKAVEA